MNESHAVADGERRIVEVEARTVDEAVARGLVRLGGLSRAEVKIEVLNEGRGGLLGFGAESARVRLTEVLPGEKPEDVPSREPEPGATAPAARPADVPVEPVKPAAPPAEAPVEPAEPAPPRPEDQAEAEALAREAVETLLGLLGFEDLVLETSDSLLPVKIEGEQSLVLTVRGPGTERLLANEARALQAMQFIVRLIIGRRTEHWANLLLDVDGDRARRMKELFQLAEQSAVLVERDGRPVSLPPMTAYERRVVHLALRDHPGVATQSIGTGDSRKVTVRRKDQLLPEL